MNRAKLLVLGALLSAATLGLAACAAGGSHAGTAPGVMAAQEDVDKHPALDVSVEDGADHVNPAEMVTVASPGGEIAEVTMVNEAGHEVEAEFDAEGSRWTTTEHLGYGRHYTVTATTSEGATTTVEFSTVQPNATTGVALSPLPDSTVGVGQAIHFLFTTAPSDRAAVEAAIDIETSNDTVGAFHWVSANELRWRPKEFWEPGTKVKVTADIYGVDMGDGLFGTDDNATSFTIGDDVRAIVDDATKSMEVYRNGELLRTMPVSLGRNNQDFATPNGTYVVGDEHSSLMMDSETFGLPHEAGGYKTEVDYATQLSYSGIYVHAAPWSVGQQGVSNVSHGCVNVSTENAAWFQEVVKRGDPVIVKNTVGGTLPAYDGLGHWNMDWEAWREG